jgi:hypothetical protein
MIKQIFNWFISPNKKPIFEDHIDLYTKLIELENRIELLEKENIETTNSIYEIANSLEARIDIIASEPYNFPEHFKIDREE